MIFSKISAYKRKYFAYAGEIFYTEWYNAENGRIKTAIEIISGKAIPISDTADIKIINIKKLKAHIKYFYEAQSATKM